MDIPAILRNTTHTVIQCKSTDFESVKSELKAYLDKYNISHIFTGDKAFNESGNMAIELHKHLTESDYEYLIAVPKINWFANTGVIIRQLEDLTGAKVVAILPDFFNYSRETFNVVNYNA